MTATEGGLFLIALRGNALVRGDRPCGPGQSDEGRARAAAKPVARLAEASHDVVLTIPSRDWARPRPSWWERVTPEALRKIIAEGHCGEGGMGPRVEAGARFVHGGGRQAVITSLDRISGTPAGRRGPLVEAYSP